MKTNNQSDQGVVIKKIVSRYHVRAGDHTLLCGLSTRNHKEQSGSTVAVGDRVRFAITGSHTGTILDVLPRRNKFSRPAPKPGTYAREQVIASNVDQIVPVFSTASPLPKWGLLDRYLVAAEAAGLRAMVCISKLDLSPPDSSMQETLLYLQARFITT